MNILIHHMRFHPDLTGTAPLVTQLAIDLAANNHSVTVITSLPHYGLKEVHPDFPKKTSLFHDAIYNGVRVIRTPVFVPKRPATFLRAINYLSYSFFSVLGGILAGKTDIVLAINPPITTSCSAWFTSIWHRAPLVVGIQDVWPEVVVRVGQLKNRVAISLSEFLERFQYRIAKQVVVLSDAMKGNLIRKGVKERKITVISNWADLENIRPMRGKNTFRQKHNLGERFIVLFAGNLGYVSSLNFVLDAAEILRRNSKILFLFVGEGSVKKDLLRRTREDDLKNVAFLTTQPEDMLADMLSSVDVGLVTLNSELGQLSVPSKTYSLMAAGKAILASVSADSEVKNLVEASGCGYWVPAQNPEKLAEAVVAMYKQRTNLPKIGRKGRIYLEKRNTRATQTKAYLELLQKVITMENR